MTSFDKAEIRVKRGGAGNCPVVIIAVTDRTWDGTPFDAYEEEEIAVPDNETGLNDAQLAALIEEVE